MTDEPTPTGTSTVHLTLTVNGDRRTAAVDGRALLLDALRDGSRLLGGRGRRDGRHTHARSPRRSAREPVPAAGWTSSLTTTCAHSRPARPEAAA